MKKRGSVRDVGLMMISVFAIVIAFLIINYATGTMVGNMLLNNQINQTTGTVSALNATTAMTNQLDYVAFGFFIAFIFAIIITGFFVGGHPLFMFLYFLVVSVLVVVSAFLSNAWETISQNASLIGSLANFPIMNHILTNFPLYIAVIGTVGIIVMFAKPRAE